MRRKLAALLCSISLFGTSVWAADQATLAVFYGNGVHEYNAGNFQGAFEELTLAINGGSDDHVHITSVA